MPNNVNVFISQFIKVIGTVISKLIFKAKTYQHAKRWWFKDLDQLCSE